MSRSLATFQKRRRQLLVCLLVATVPLLLVSRSILTGREHEIVEITGTFLIVAGIVGRVWSIMYIGGRKSAVVVELGPYSITRNPLYLFSTIAAGGIGAQSGSVVLAAAFAVIAYLVLHATIEREETHLSDHLGQAYLDYKARVPRLLPRGSGFKDAEFLSVKPKIFYSTVRDSSAFLLAIPFFELIEHAQDVHLLPVLLHIF